VVDSAEVALVAEDADVVVAVAEVRKPRKNGCQ
jgi:hypothetical protein